MHSASTCDWRLKKLTPSQRSSSTRKHAIRWRVAVRQLTRYHPVQVVKHVHREPLRCRKRRICSPPSQILNFDWVMQR